MRDSPSLRREISGLVAEQMPVAAKLAAADLIRHGEPADVVWARLGQGGLTGEQVVEDWFPDTPT